MGRDPKMGHEHFLWGHGGLENVDFFKIGVYFFSVVLFFQISISSTPVCIQVCLCVWLFVYSNYKDIIFLIIISISDTAPTEWIRIYAHTHIALIGLFSCEC